MRAINPVKSFSLVVLALGAVACGPASQDASASTSEELSIPPALAVPAGNKLDFSLNAVGVQIYQCQATASGQAWVFQAPKANLFDDEGELKATHFAGPTWQSVDGSSVVGSKIAAVTISATAIPELLLQAVSHSGSGKMSEVTYIQRLDTAGGIAPASGCDAAHVGTSANVNYTAQYFFYRAE